MIRFLLTVLTFCRTDRSFQMKCVIAPPSVGAVLASVMLGGGEIQKGREPMNTKLNKFLTAFLIVLMILTTLTGCSESSSGNAEKPKKDYSKIEMNPNISIPGYENLDFKAGKTKQSVDFYNPDDNTCFFRISLVIKYGADTANGKEGNVGEETVLWTSEMIEPGEHVKSIKLNKELESGEYAATLKYECFRLQDKSPLNGSNVELTLNVN